MKKIVFIAAIISIFNFQFSISRAQQPDAVYKLLRYEWTLNADGSSDFHYRHEVQILRNRALVAYADKGETFVVYNPDLEEVTINEVYTRQLDGTRVDMPQNAYIYQLPEECADCGRFNHIRELAMVHTGMELGCVIVVDYTIHRQYNLLFEDIPLQRECPVENMEVVINYPNGMDLKWDIIGNQYLSQGGVNRTTSFTSGTRTLQFSLLNRQQAPREPYMPADIVPTLRIYNSVPNHTPAFDQTAFKGASSAIGQQMTDTDELKNVSAIRDFIIDNIHLNDIHPSHLGYIHSTPEVTWQTGCGTAIDKAVLLAAILNSEGYRARVIGDNMDEVGVFVDTIEYRLDIRHKAQSLEINGKAHDEIEKLEFIGEAQGILDTLEDGFYRLFLDQDHTPLLPSARNLALTRTAPLSSAAYDINIERTYPLEKGLKLLGGDIEQKASYRGIGSVEINIAQKGNSLKVVRRLKIEKTLIPVDDYSKYRQLIALWQNYDSVILAGK